MKLYYLCVYHGCVHTYICVCARVCVAFLFLSLSVVIVITLNQFELENTETHTTPFAFNWMMLEEEKPFFQEPKTKFLLMRVCVVLLCFALLCSHSFTFNNFSTNSLLTTAIFKNFVHMHKTKLTKTKLKKEKKTIFSRTCVYFVCLNYIRIVLMFYSVTKNHLQKNVQPFYTHFVFRGISWLDMPNKKNVTKNNNDKQTNCCILCKSLRICFPFFFFSYCSKTIRKQ